MTKCKILSLVKTLPILQKAEYNRLKHLYKELVLNLNIRILNAILTQALRFKLLNQKSEFVNYSINAKDGLL